MDNKNESKLQIKSELKSLEQLTFDEKTVKLIKDTIAVGASDNELQLFLYQAKRTGLDPLNRQIFFIKRGDKVNIQTSIDGFRIIAERHGDYAGQDEPEFIYDGSNKLTVAKVRVYKWRGDQRYLAATGVAHMNEYMPQGGQDFMWRKMPHTMLAKVAEALALRKAFPHDLSGIYSDDEMAQSNAPTAPKKTYPKVTPEKANILSNLFVVKGKEQGEVLSYFKVGKLEDLNTMQADALLKRLNSFPDKESVMEEHIAEGEYVDPDEADLAIDPEKCKICGSVLPEHKVGCTERVKTDADGEELPLKETIS